MTEISRYGTWKSPISIEDLFAAATEPMHPFVHDGCVYWLQSLAEEGGRVALMTLQAGQPLCLTPAPFNIRTKVHEYGGRCFCVTGDDIVFNSFQDGCLYRLPLSVNAATDAAPTLVHRSPETVCGFADLQWVDGFVIAVTECEVPGGENQNSLVAVTVDDPDRPAFTLAAGRDFYAAPVVNGPSTHLAWLEWDHPFMPWDRTRLMQAALHRSESPRLTEIEVVLDADETTISQPGFIDDGGLVFAMDSDTRDWSNLVLAGPDGLRPLTGESAEFGEAHWVFGNRRWVQCAPDMLLAVCTTHDGDCLLAIDPGAEREPRVLFQDASLSQLSVTNSGCILMASAENRPPRVVTINAYDHSVDEPVTSPAPLLAAGYSQPQTRHDLTAGGEEVWAYYYPPYHPQISGPEGDAPPLLVMVHGGPTARTSRAFHPLRQYFPTLGFAVLDVNHRGSTGYGRRYRQRLLGEWGEVDVEDIITCVTQLIADGLADPDAIFIRGGSAGGYAVLRALTRHPAQFAAGASYYGIGNLVTLAEITHKFESRYTDRLVGEPYDAQRARSTGSRFQQRSPVNELDRLRSPLILFQGGEDRIVPPAVSREVAEMLEKRGIAYEYHEYPGEGHGFRNQETRIDSLEKETAFFQRIIRQNTPG